MMKTNNVAGRAAFAAMLAMALSVALSACDNPVLDGLTEQLLLGEWVNSAGSYDNWPRPPHLILNEDGTFEFYDRMMSTWGTAYYQVDDDWKTSNGHYFKVHYILSGGTTYGFSLVRIAKDGQTYEANNNDAVMSYPTEINSSAMNYIVFYRP